MIDVHDLILLAEEYARLEAVEEKTVSGRVFDDSKKIAALRAGGDITVGRFNAAFRWFSDHWPEGAAWPESIVRPSPISEAAE